MMHEDKLNFFISTPSNCGYLSDRKSISLFADPEYPMSPAIYSILIEHGFRRSGNHVYRPECPQCNECVPVRVDVTNFRPSRSQKRIWKQNQDIKVKPVPVQFNTAHYALYQKYQQTRHGDGEMAQHSEIRYMEFLKSRWCDSVFYELWLDNKLIGLAIVDFVKTGLSAFYTFFDPDYEKRSLGNFAILWQIEKARSLKLPWIYLGYWIEHCDKMNYKTRYQPLEMFIKEKWIPYQK